MLEQDIIAKMRKLISQLKQHNHAYYVLDNPILEDSEYDLLRGKLAKLEQQFPHFIQIDSPINQVGDKPLPFFTQVNHKIPMLSLGNIFNVADLQNFFGVSMSVYPSSIKILIMKLS